MLEELLRLNLFAFFLIFARIGTAIMFLPGFSATYVAARFRLALALAISFVTFPVLAAQLPVPPSAFPDMAVMFVGEIIIGSFFGLILRVLISSLQTAGTIASLASSMANALVQDPIAEQQSSTISGFPCHFQARGFPIPVVRRLSLQMCCVKPTGNQGSPPLSRSLWFPIVSA